MEGVWIHVMVWGVGVWDNVGVFLYSKNFLEYSFSSNSDWGMELNLHHPFYSFLTYSQVNLTILTSMCSGHSVQWFHSIQCGGSIPFHLVVPFHSVQ